MTSPITAMVYRCVRCVKCGKQGYMTCACWTRCECGHTHATDERCPNPAHLPYRSTAALSDLGTSSFSLRAPITVEIEDYVGEVIATWQHVWGAGTTEAKAIAKLKAAIAETYLELQSFPPNKLGADLTRDLAVMRAAIVDARRPRRRR